MLGRFDEAIKDYTNAVIVYKEQNKNEQEVAALPPKKPKEGEEAEEEYYAEKQIMFHEVYLNRAITYIKYAY